MPTSNTPKKAVFKPSPEQAAIHTAMAKGKTHLQIKARAGTGKSTTTVHGIKKVPKSQNVVVVAFNVHNAKDVQGKIEALGITNANSSTWNSFGWRAYKQYKSSAQIDAHKLSRIVSDVVDDEKKLKYVAGPVERVTRLMKNYLLEPTELNIDLVIDKHGFDWTPFTIDQIKEYVPDVMEACLKEESILDFDDQMWMTVKLGLPIPQFDMMIIDEAQDATAVQEALATRACPNGRIVFVGDNFQAIFSFRGSDIFSMERLEKTFAGTERGIETLPLSITRRCPKSHVELVHSIVPDIQAMPNAPDGKIECIEPDKILEHLRPGDLVLCRVNAPLVGTCYKLIRKGIKATVRGRDIGNGLKSLIKKAKTANTSAEMLVQVQDYAEREMDKLRALGVRGEGRLASLQDKVDCLLEISDGCTTINEVESRIEQVFSDFDEEGKPKHAVVLGTVHRCVHPRTLVETCKGLQRIQALNPIRGCIASPFGPSQYEGKYIKPSGKTLRFITKRGYELEVSSDHGLTVWRRGQGHQRIEAEHIQVGDWLRLKLGHAFNPPPPPLPTAPRGLDLRTVQYTIPQVMTDYLAELLGLLVADGTIYEHGFRIIKRYPSVVDRFCYLTKKVFGCNPYSGLNYETREDRQRVPRGEVHSTQLAQWLLSFDGLAPNAKDIPELILQSPLAMQRSFLRGLFEDGTINLKDGIIDHIHWDNVGTEIVRTVQTMLLRLGIASSRAVRSDRSILYLYSDFARKFASQIGFIADEKNERCRTHPFRPDEQHTLPITKEQLEEIKHLLSRSAYNNAIYRGYLSRATAWKCLEQQPGIPFFVELLQWIYQPVGRIEEGESETICVTIPDCHRFLQNGFDGWNTKGLESPHITVLEPDLLPHPMAKTDLDKQAERNIAYVAGTRGKYEMDAKGKLLQDSTLTFAGPISAIFNSPTKPKVN